VLKRWLRRHTEIFSGLFSGGEAANEKAADLYRLGNVHVVISSPYMWARRELEASRMSGDGARVRSIRCYKDQIQMNQEIVSLLQAALECSIFLDPTDPGLTYQEVLEVGKRAGYQAGEVEDAVSRAGEHYPHSNKLITDWNTRQAWWHYTKEEPDYRNFPAFDFVVSELNDRVRADGMRNAQVDRKLVVERAIASGHSRNDIEAAITYQVLGGQLTEKDGVLRFPHDSGVRGLPSETLKQLSRAQTYARPVRARAYPIVKDIIERRSDGRPPHAEPLDAFAEQLDKLNYGAFTLWWKQMVIELRRGDTNTSPVAVCVLSAALVEGALTFVVQHARSRNLGVFRSRDFDGPARTWKIDDLVSSAASGSDTAILDIPTKSRAEILISRGSGFTPAACFPTFQMVCRIFVLRKHAMPK
jgi:hypothetical protein